MLGTFDYMLCMNNYTQEYVDECRASVNAQLSAYRDLISAARKAAAPSDTKLDAAIDSFEPVFFNNMVLVMDSYFTHRSRTIELKDGNPLNEVRILSNSMMLNQGIVAADKSIKSDPAKTVLKYEVGDKIRLTEQDFMLIFEAFFAEIERKFV